MYNVLINGSDNQQINSHNINYKLTNHNIIDSINNMNIN